MDEFTTTIASLVSTLDRTILSRLCSKDQVRAHHIMWKELGKHYNKQAVIDRLVRIANCISFEVLRQSTFHRMGYTLESPPNKASLRALLCALMPEEHIDRQIYRPEIGLSLYALRNLSQLHVWHGRPYIQALDDPEFVYQAYDLERIRSLRDRCAMRDASERMAAQVEFAKCVISMTNEKTVGDDCKHLLGYIEDAALQIGNRMLTKLGFDGKKRANALQNAFMNCVRRTHVGQQNMSNILRVYLQVAISIRDISSFSSKVAYAWGMHAFYDVFIDGTRQGCRTDQDLMALFRNALESVRNVFCSLDVIETYEATNAGVLDLVEYDAALARRSEKRKERRRKVRQRAVRADKVSEYSGGYALSMEEMDEVEVIYSTQTMDDLFAHT